MRPSSTAAWGPFLRWVTGRKLIMTFPVTATSHGWPTYRARGGYARWTRPCADAPEQVTKEVAASGILRATAARRSRPAASGA
jgi:hypothetical protein